MENKIGTFEQWCQRNRSHRFRELFGVHKSVLDKYSQNDSVQNPNTGVIQDLNPQQIQPKPQK